MLHEYFQGKCFNENICGVLCLTLYYMGGSRAIRLSQQSSLYIWQQFGQASAGRLASLAK